jgi:hypothetical protein
MWLLSQNYRGMKIDQTPPQMVRWEPRTPPGYSPNRRITDDLLNDPKFMTGFMRSVASGEAPGRYAMDAAQWQQAFNWYQRGGVPGGETTLRRIYEPVGDGQPRRSVQPCRHLGRNVNSQLTTLLDSILGSLLPITLTNANVALTLSQWQSAGVFVLRQRHPALSECVRWSTGNRGPIAWLTIGAPTAPESARNTLSIATGASIRRDATRRRLWRHRSYDPWLWRRAWALESVGIEAVARNNGDVNDARLATVRGLVAKNYRPATGHSESGHPWHDGAGCRRRGGVPCAAGRLATGARQGGVGTVVATGFIPSAVRSLAVVVSPVAARPISDSEAVPFEPFSGTAASIPLARQALGLDSKQQLACAKKHRAVGRASGGKTARVVTASERKGRKSV